MYKTVSRNEQNRSGRSAAMVTSVDEKLKQTEAYIDQQIDQDLLRFRDPTHVSKLGGWSVDRFANRSIVPVNLHFMLSRNEDPAIS